MKIIDAIKTWSGNQVPGSYGGHTVCTATHPDMPNYSGNSRGRKLHLMKTEKITFCNMLVDGISPTNYKTYSMYHNGFCKVCLSKSKKPI